MIDEKKSRIYLIGFMGVGKSTIGRQLAKKLGYTFLDLDHVFEKKYKLSIDNFFSKYGEELFRQLESELLTSTFSKDNIVIATGGGTACNKDGISLMNENGLTVYLEMPVGGLINRLTKGRKKRPLIKGLSENNLQEDVKQRLQARLQYYNQAKIITDALDFTIDQLIEQLKAFE